MNYATQAASAWKKARQRGGSAIPNPGYPLPAFPGKAVMFRTPGAARMYLSGPPAQSGLGALGPPSPGRVWATAGISFLTSFMVLELLIAGSKNRFNSTKDRLYASGLIAGALTVINTIALPLLATTSPEEV